ncbi:MAG: ATP-dependent DNA helicase RecG [Acidiferrobacter sp.]
MPSSISAKSAALVPWERPVTVLSGVGPALAEKLGRLGLYTVSDLVFHLPSRYEDRTEICPIRRAAVGQTVVIEAEIVAVNVTGSARPTLVLQVADAGGRLTLRFFHFTVSQRRKLVVGTRVSAFGEIRFGLQGPEMVHPEYRCQGEGSLQEQALTPVYPSTEGLSVKVLRRLIRAAAALVLPELVDYLPASPQNTGLSLAEALTLLHAPAKGCALDDARRRLAFEELVTHHAHLLQLRHAVRKAQAPRCRGAGLLVPAFLAGLPFLPTDGQSRAIAEILCDLQENQPMQRLLQGDVGSGKTLVAAAAALTAIEAGFQVALMAPTELLARQHMETFGAWFAPLGIEMTGLMRLGSGGRAARARLSEETTRFVIGTQALFQEAVSFDRLGLIIIDEQHRFGVHERQALRTKGASGKRVAHLLAMSATPIPRTLAQSVYADLDLSILDTRPPGRAPVSTVALSQARRSEVIARVRQACQGGAKAYWVCPLIDEGELDLKAAVALHAELARDLPGLVVGLIHGRMKPADKDRAMEDFVHGAVQVLVATTVIEVGVDVPTASLLVIENAERLGLAQLHQLRGRVGRGAIPGHCVLLYKPPLGDLARERIGCLRATDDGFAIARKDLELRGAGEIFGARQTGLPSFRVADVIQDEALLPAAARVAATLLQGEPGRLLGLRRRWLRERHDLSQA